MKSMLPGALAVISGIVAVFSFLEYQKTAGGLWIIMTIVFLIARLILGAMLLSCRVNKT